MFFSGSWNSWTDFDKHGMLHSASNPTTHDNFSGNSSMCGSKRLQNLSHLQVSYLFFCFSSMYHKTFVWTVTSLTLLGALEVFWFDVTLITLVYNNNNNNNVSFCFKDQPTPFIIPKLFFVSISSLSGWTEFSRISWQPIKKTSQNLTRISRTLNITECYKTIGFNLLFSERELKDHVRYMSSTVRLSVCRL